MCEALAPPPSLLACRAYKLGKSRWSYNSVDLVLREGGSGAARRSAGVVLAAATAVRFAPAYQASEGFCCGHAAGVAAIKLSVAVSGCLEAQCPVLKLGWGVRQLPAACTALFCRPLPAVMWAMCTHLPLCPLQPQPPQGSVVGYLLQLDNGAKVQAHVYLCYADARPCKAGAAAAAGGGEDEEEEQFAW